MAAIEVHQLTYSYPTSSAPALRDISLQIEPGQFTAILGANNAGKTTLCLAMAGLIPALYHGSMQGTVKIEGMDTRQHGPDQFAGRVGLVLQNPANQLSGMRYTVFEEVAFGLENLGIPRPEMKMRVEQALAFVGLETFGGRSPYALSGGQQQRLALASILAMQPSILVLDEPTAMLDPQGSQEIIEIIQKMAQADTTVIIAEHQFEWVARYADRVIALANGEVILDGSPQTVLSSPALLASKIGWLRYTHAAHQASQRGGWPDKRPLPVTLEQAAEGFQSGQTFQEKQDADPD
jgi:energy-coupling factor transporter ATP-binding protein EcfA2